METEKSYLVVMNSSGRLLKDKLYFPEGFLETKRIADLKEFVATEVSRVDANRLKLRRYHNNIISDDSYIRDLGIKSKDLLQVADLGPQVSWKLVYILEYLGPLAVHPLVYFNRNIFFLTSSPPNNIQRLTFWCIMAHFLKREFESIFIHKFSRNTMNLSKLKKNCLYYLFLYGFFISLTLYRPGYDGGLKSQTLISVVLSFWMISVASNFYVHLTLSRLAKNVGGIERKIPQGYGFKYVSCPHYFFEITGWLSLFILTWNPFILISTVVGAVQMTIWALIRHRKYIRDSKNKEVSKRKAILPFLL